MRRSAPHATDDLNLLLRAVLEFRAQDGNHLPGYAEPIMFFLGMQPEGSAGMRELRERLGLGQSRTSRLCAALGRAGLVEVVTPTEDRRASLVKLTPKGARLVDKVLAAYRSRSR
jgi:DNA-binding MarR family transcriptional regulator